MTRVGDDLSFVGGNLKLDPHMKGSHRYKLVYKPIQLHGGFLK